MRVIGHPPRFDGGHDGRRWSHGVIRHDKRGMSNAPWRSADEWIAPVVERSFDAVEAAWLVDGEGHRVESAL